MSCNISKCGFGSKKRRFGSSDMSLFQSYTGMPPAQMQAHLDGIPTNLRSNFYTNLYGSKKRRGFRRRFSKRIMNMPSFSPIKVSKIVSRRSRRSRRGSRKYRRASRIVRKHIRSFRLPIRIVRKHTRSFRLPIRKIRRRSFGKMNPSLSHIMGNTQPNDMSTFQGYTGVAPMQMVNHLDNVPTSIRSNFYTDI